MLLLTQRKKPPKERTLMLCDEIGNLGRMDALLMPTTLLRAGGLTVRTFWQNAAQFHIYGSRANTILENAGGIQIFGIQNHRMAQDLANVIGGISADALLALPLMSRYSSLRASSGAPSRFATMMTASFRRVRECDR